MARTPKKVDFSFLDAPSPGSVEHAQETLKSAYEAYRLARRDRPREHNHPVGYSGDGAILSSFDLMNRRVRDLVRNTAQGKRIVTAITNLVVGRGFQSFAWPFKPSELFEITTEIDTLKSGEIGPRLQYALESDDLYDEYSSKENFDFEGRLSRQEMERMAIAEAVKVGNALIVRVFRKKFDLVPLSYQIIEREMLDDSKDREAKSGENAIVGGVELDRDNRVVAYHIRTDHPYDGFDVRGRSRGGGDTFQRIPARSVLDVALYDRPSSTLGASWYDASGQSAWDRDSYMESEIRTAAVESVFLLVAKLVGAEKSQSSALGFDDDLDDSDEYGNRSFKVGHSPVSATIGVNEELEMVRPTRPNRDAEPFIRLLDHDIASATPLAYSTLTGDYRNTNFTSSRAAKMDEDLNVLPLQDWFGATALRMRREFNAVAAAYGLFESVDRRTFAENPRTYQRFDAIGNGRDLVDPFKEGEARTTRLRTRVSTFKAECAKRGEHWIRVLMQQAIEARVFELFDVVPDFTKAGNGNQQTSGEEIGSESSSEDMADEIADRVLIRLEQLRKA